MSSFPTQTNSDLSDNSVNPASMNQSTSTPSVMTVEQLNVSIKKMLEGEFDLIWVQGEISNFKAHTSGHYYFSLKDKKSQISAVMFRGYNSKLKFAIEDGMEVIVRGRISVYEPRGNYQILCETMEPVGAGALQKAFEQLKTKLKNEGLFDPAKKRPIPHFPQRIAVVTSPTGAAIQDILNVMSRRAPHVEIFVVPTIVQGAAAGPQIRTALLKALQIPNLDVLIVGRGGGSMEDLWCFNDEELAREIAKSPVPVISAVGHEIDFTICDFVADLRAPTPSAAAELVAKSSNEIVRQVGEMQKFFARQMAQRIVHDKKHLIHLTARLVDPKKKLEDYKLRNDDLLTRLEYSNKKYFSEKRMRVQLLTSQLKSPQIVLDQLQQKINFTRTNLTNHMQYFLDGIKNELSTQMGLLDSLSPLRVVDRGYSILQKNGVVIKQVKQLQPKDKVQARLSDGTIELEFQSVIQDSKGN